jgi:hypothetical protein
MYNGKNPKDYVKEYKMIIVIVSPSCLQYRSPYHCVVAMAKEVFWAKLRKPLKSIQEKDF